MHRRTLLAGTGSLTLAGLARTARADTPGVTATEIKIGNTDAYSGPASAYGAIGKGLVAYFKRLNEQGGIAGRMVNFITLDDGYSRRRRSSRRAGWWRATAWPFILNGLGTRPNPPCSAT